jgi:probable HAF family extracellular repeat protein
MISLPGAPAGFSNSAEDINASGKVCGHQFNATFSYVGWVFDSATGSIVELPTLGRQSETRAINDAGEVVGASSMLNNQRRPVLWTANGDIVDLGFLPVPNYTQGIANGINNSRWIVGVDAFDGGGVQGKGWLWIAGVKVELLSLLNDPVQQAQWSGLLHPLDINNHGAIVGIGNRDGIPGRAFLMRPIGSDTLFGDGFDGR